MFCWDWLSETPVMYQLSHYYVQIKNFKCAMSILYIIVTTRTPDLGLWTSQKNYSLVKQQKLAETHFFACGNPLQLFFVYMRGLQNPKLK